jgi:hypothetical protein
MFWTMYFLYAPSFKRTSRERMSPADFGAVRHTHTQDAFIWPDKEEGKQRSIIVPPCLPVILDWTGILSSHHRNHCCVALSILFQIVSRVCRPWTTTPRNCLPKSIEHRSVIVQARCFARVGQPSIFTKSRESGEDPC